MGSSNHIDKGEIASFFDRRAPTYDGIESHRWMARRLVEIVAPPVGAQVLDVATGTGLAARAAARAVGETGRVVATDISAGMLAEAGRLVAEERLSNVALLAAAADALPFPDASFDVVLCVSSIPFFPSASAALREWRRVLRRGGAAAFTTLHADPITSHRVLREVALREAGAVVIDPNAELGTSERAERAMLQAEFGGVTVTVEAFEQPFAMPDAAWSGVVQHPLSVALRSLAEAELERVRAAFLAEYGALYRKDAVDRVPVLFAVAS